MSLSSFYDWFAGRVADLVVQRLAPLFQGIEKSMADFSTALDDLQSDFDTMATDIKAVLDKLSNTPNVPADALQRLQALHARAQQFKTDLEGVTAQPTNPPTPDQPPTDQPTT